MAEEPQSYDNKMIHESIQALLYSAIPARMLKYLIYFI